MLYLIGLGLTKESIGIEAKKICQEADRVYLEGYTVDFPYSKPDLEEVIGVEIKTLNRKDVESDRLVSEAKNKDIALLVYGSPLMATTHISLVLEAEKAGIDYRVIHNTSIFDAVSNTGLQPYKFGKIGSIPDWEKKGKSKSFIDIIEGNMKIKAHTLLLVDIGLEFEKALGELKEASDNKIKRMVVCSQLGTEKEEIYFDSVDELEKMDVKKPYCFIIPSKLHFREKEVLEKVSED